jgi:hypothetical protein
MKGINKGSESENTNITGEKKVYCILYAKGIIYHELVLEKKSVNSKFYKEVIKKLMALIRRLRTVFQENGSWYLLHGNEPAHSSGVVSLFLAKRGIPRVIPFSFLP